MGSKYNMASRNQKGFTLIELAIVLVIIGIILGAVLKGQDLIANARAKKVINWEKSWETALWTYLDRKGNFPGDSDKNGVIGKNESGSTTTAIYEIGAANFINPPTETITVGSVTFYVRIGNSTGVVTTAKNVIVICKSENCATGFAADELVYVESMDTTIDGSTDPLTGNVRAATAVTLADTNKTVNGLTEASETSWTATTHKALVYFFDRPR
jgi:prepilin-type N-terminal cleavage/methylation domain-containing protein